MRKWWPLVAICLGTFMLLVDVTIVNVALPDISRSLHAFMAAVAVGVAAYILIGRADRESSVPTEPDVASEPASR